MPLAGIDVHTHVHDARARALQGPDAVRKFEEKARYFKREAKHTSVEEQAELYRSKDMMAVLVNGTDVTITGLTPLPNDFIADTVRQFPDVFLGMGAIDPWQGELARREIVRMKELGLVGIGELNPARQHFYPNDRRFYPLWEEAERQGLVLLFHSGYAAAGSGTPGGGGVKLKYCQPMLLDDVAADFIGLTVVLRTRPCPGRTRRSRSRRTSRTSTSTCRAGRRSTSRRSWSGPPTRCSSARSCSARASRSSHPSGGWRTSSSSTSSPRSGR